MTEPGTGSDSRQRGDDRGARRRRVRLNGSKTFITNGINADLIITVAKTDPKERHTGMSLLMVERGMEGFESGRNLDKIGMHSNDTAEWFTDVRVPLPICSATRAGFPLPPPQPRSGAPVDRDHRGLATARAALDWTLEYVEERRRSARRSVRREQQVRLGQVATEVDIGQAYIDQLRGRPQSTRVVRVPTRPRRSTGARTSRSVQSIVACNCSAATDT